MLILDEVIETAKKKKGDEEGKRNIPLQTQRRGKKPICITSPSSHS
jgi:hypothetical protein